MNKRTPAVFEPMTPLEMEAIGCLSDCSFPVASWPKRFARDMYRRLAPARNEDRTISAAQRAALWRTCHKFRRQISIVRVREFAAGFVAAHGKRAERPGAPEPIVKPRPEPEERRHFRDEDWCLFGPPPSEPVRHVGDSR